MATASAKKLEAALAATDKRVGAIGKTIKLRAVARGQYGHPVAELVEPGTVFRFAVADLPEFKGQHGRDCIVVDGKKLLLPTWCVDAKTPVQTDEDEDEIETVAPGRDDDVI